MKNADMPLLWPRAAQSRKEGDERKGESSTKSWSFRVKRNSRNES